jgi:RimJ/RimL family protein N-acetyltransferase
VDNTSPFCFVWAMNDVIETERLVLRPLRDDDAMQIVSALDDFDICRNLARVPWPYHRSDALEFLEFVAGCDQRSRFSAICKHEKTDTLIGIISYEWSDAKQNAELGYWLSQPHWGKGLMTEAAATMVNHAFIENRHEILVSCFHDDNPVSGKILSRVGFERVGACSNFSKAHGKEVPVTNMRLTREHWLKMKNAGH